MLERFDFDDKLIIEKNNDDYQKSINTYLDNLTDEQIAEMKKIADDRFIYLSIVKKLQQNKKKIDTSKSLVEIYLDSIKESYGSKLFGQFETLLSILAFAKEPLLTRELSFMFGEPYVTYVLLAYFADLKPLLLIERSEDGNLISIAHTQNRDFFKEKYEDRYDELKKEFISYIKDIKTIDELDLETYKEAYLMVYISIDSYDTKSAKLMYDYASHIIADEKSSFRTLNYAQKILDNAIAIYENNTPQKQDELSKAYLKKQNCYIGWDRTKKQYLLHKKQ